MVVLCWRENKVKRTGQRKRGTHDNKPYTIVCSVGTFLAMPISSDLFLELSTITSGTFLLFFNSCLKSILSFLERLLFGGKNKRARVRMIFNNTDEPGRYYANYEISRSQNDKYCMIPFI